MPIDLALRLGPRQTVQCGGLRMAINDDVRKCVLFFGVTDPKGGITYGGTGFLVLYEDETKHRSRYLVTCRHVAKRLDLDFYIRANTVNGEAEDLPVETADWQYHPDPTVDIAAAGIALNGLHFDQLTVPLAKAVLPEDLGCGQRVHIVGLFRLYFGKKRNVPIVHTGHLAALADSRERVPIRERGSDKVIESEVHLIEAQTLDGLSGSPVFIQEYQWWRRGANTITGFGPITLLGVYQGAWDARPGEILAEDRNLGDARIRVPVGMGLVVPIERVTELIRESEVFKKQREAMRRAEQRQAAQGAATMDDALPARETELSGPGPNPTHREDFSRLVGAASKRRPPAGKT